MPYLSEDIFTPEQIDAIRHQVDWQVRQRLRRWWIIGASVLVMTVIGAAWGVKTYSDSQHKQQQTNHRLSLAVCERQNDGRRVLRKFFIGLVTHPPGPQPKNPPPKTAAQLAAQAAFIASVNKNFAATSCATLGEEK